VQLVEIENSLPNGFHDALLESVTVDYGSRRSLIRLRLCVGDPDAVVKDKREAYKGADLELLDIVYFVIEAPDPGSEYEAVKSLWIDGGENRSDSGARIPVPQALLPPGAFAYWFFVRDWNSFIHVAAMDAKLEWHSEDGFLESSTEPTQ
jgi:hypothetical protein